MVSEGVENGGRSFIAGLLPTRSYGLKLLLVCMLALAMTIPALFVFVINVDRESRSREVVNEVSQLRGGAQTIVGPMIVAPYERPVEGSKQQTTVSALYVVHAETGSVVAQIETEVLHRAIYDVPVYEAALAIAADFDLSAAREEAASLNVDWSRARIMLGAWDLRGAREDAAIVLGTGEALPLAPMSAQQELGGYGFQIMGAELPGADVRDRLQVEASLVFSGSQRFSVAAFAKSTDVEMSSDWPHPSFDGWFLPDTREVGGDGFSARWSVPYLARGASGSGDALTAGLSSVSGRDLGVSLIQPQDVYMSMNRALKYAVMFIGFVFLAFFLFEVTSRRRVHAAQYVLIGLAQAIFYVMLLALAEHLGFPAAFGVAALLTVSAISFYAASIYDSWIYGVRALVVFSLVYALLYVLLRLVDYALLVGALASFTALVAAMLLTRRVDWYGSRAAG